MKTDPLHSAEIDWEDSQLIEPVGYQFGLDRRAFVQVVATGFMVVAGPWPAFAQRSAGPGGARTRHLSARLHVGKDGLITLLTGKVEAGQGARGELSQAAAEELRVPVSQIQVVMADTGL